MRIANFVIAALAVACTACSDKSASGIYINSDASHLVAIHLVEGSQGGLSGQIEFFEVKESGVLNEKTLAFSGIRGGDSISIKLETPLAGLTGTQAITGKIAAANLTLTGFGQSGVYKKSSTRSRDDELERLRAQAIGNVREQLSRRAAASWDKLSVYLNQYTDLTKELEAQVEPAKKSYGKLAAERLELVSELEARSSTYPRDEAYWHANDAEFRSRSQILDLDDAILKRFRDSRAVRLLIENSILEIEALCGDENADLSHFVCEEVAGAEQQLANSFKRIQNAYAEIDAARALIER